LTPLRPADSPRSQGARDRRGRTRARRAAALLTALVALGAPAAAHASGSAVVRDCTDDGRLSKSYSQKDYADALKNIPTDVDEYTDCRDVIRRAQLGGAGGSHGGGHGGSGGGTAGGGGGATGGGPSASGGAPATAQDALSGASPDEIAAIDRARQGAGTEPVRVGNASLTPHDLSSNDLSSLSDVPTPLLVALALLCGACLAGAASVIVNRVRARRSPTLDA
jgi:hypothetical protein